MPPGIETAWRSALCFSTVGAKVTDDYTDIKISRRERRKLKSLAHEIFARLIVDRQTSTVNDAQDRLIFGLLFALVLVIVCGTFVLDQIFSFSAQLAEMVPLVAEFSPLIVILAPLLFLTGAIMLFRPALSEASFSFVGRSIIFARKLHPKSSSAQSSLEDVHYWLRSDGNRASTEANSITGRACGELLPADLCAGLSAMSKGDAERPFLVARRILERKYWHLYLGNWFRSPRPNVKGGGETATYYQRARALRNSIKIGICLNVLGAELRDEAMNGLRWMREHFTKRDYQQSPYWDEYDIALRFRTSGPHLRWPRSTEPMSDGEIPTYRIISCIENPCNFAVYVLRVRDIIDALPETLREFGDGFEGDDETAIAHRRATAARALCLLANTPLAVFGKRDEYSLLARVGRDAVDESIVRRLDGGSTDIDSMDVDDVLGADWGMRWDPNRIILSRLNPSSDSRVMSAIALLTHGINNSMRTRAKPVRLKRGDVIFLDNMRAIAGRYEHDYSRIALWKRALNVPAEWWLRGFYGFRISHQGASDAEDVRARFGQESETQ